MRRFLFFHAIIPFALTVVATLVLDYLKGDLFVADLLYYSEGQEWSLKRNWLLDNFIHEGGRTLVIALITSNVAFLITCWIKPSWHRHRGKAAFSLTCVAISLILISWLKSVTNIDCPWDYARYGGDVPSHMIASAIFGSGTGNCFPAGHASGGYAWLALYFLCLRYFPQQRFIALIFSLMMGGIFGIAQQLRGAHLLSHDIWTITICWYVPLTAFLLLTLKDHYFKQRNKEIAR